ncbi:MAG: nucleotidyltransferase domain-containing protein [Lentisphaerae bacterium]|nr:nucleotidyltransferase domain-containing protein [Lentisphaerota bacterium]
MDVLSEFLSSRTRAAIMRLLFGLNPVPLHAREIERRAGVTIGAVRQEAAKLLRLGLITLRKDGNRTYYEANRRHPLTEDIHRMVLKTVGLADVLRAAFGGTGIRCAFVFGSIAEGTAKAESDIDLMIIGSIGLRKVTSLLSGVGNQLGREINSHVMTPEEFGQRACRKEHFIVTVMLSSKLFIVGTEDDLKTK